MLTPLFLSRWLGGVGSVAFELGTKSVKGTRFLQALNNFTVILIHNRDGPLGTYRTGRCRNDPAKDSYGGQKCRKLP